MGMDGLFVINIVVGNCFQSVSSNFGYNFIMFDMQPVWAHFGAENPSPAHRILRISQWEMTQIIFLAFIRIVQQSFRPEKLTRQSFGDTKETQIYTMETTYFSSCDLIHLWIYLRGWLSVIFVVSPLRILMITWIVSSREQFFCVRYFGRSKFDDAKI